MNQIKETPKTHRFVIVLHAGQPHLEELAMAFAGISERLGMEMEIKEKEILYSFRDFELTDEKANEVNGAIQGGFQLILNALKKIDEGA